MIKGAERVRTFDKGRVPEKLKAGRPRVDAEGSRVKVGEAICQVIDTSDTNVSDDIPWGFAVA